MGCTKSLWVLPSLISDGRRRYKAEETESDGLPACNVSSSDEDALEADLGGAGAEKKARQRSVTASASSKSREREPSEPRPAAAGDAGVASADGHAHNGSVWLGICGRGIDIYEVTSLKHPFNLANPVKPSKTQ